MTITQFPPNDFMAQNIIQGATMLIWNLSEEGRLSEEYQHLLYSIDWVTAEEVLEGAGGSVVFQDDKYHFCKEGVFYYDAPTKHDLITAYYNHDLSDFEVKAAEWWIVSEWLASRLKEKGETVDSFYGLTIWARCDSGSAIKTDLVIQEIYLEYIKGLN